MKISIITAVYNASETIVDSIASLRQQNYLNIEHIIVDGASTDGTLEIIKKSISDSSILISEADDGIYDALNKGIEKASGEIIGFLHADDLLANPTVLSDIADAFSDSSIDCVYGNLIYVDKKDINKIIRRWKSKNFSKSLLNMGWMPPHPTLFMRRKCYMKFGGFDANFKISADYQYVLRLFSSPKFKSVYLDKVLVQMRVGGASNKSLASILRKSYEDWLALRSIGYGVASSLKALFFKNFLKIIQFL